MNEKSEILTQQLVTTAIYLGSLFLSLILTYNDKLCIERKKSIFSNEKATNLAIFNRVLVLGLTLSYLYINYRGREIARRKNDNLELFNLQISASELSTLASIIVLYVVLESGNYNIISSIENPNL